MCMMVLEIEDRNGFMNANSMKIAFIHYHLKTGGVTTCLKQQLEALKNDCDVRVISGELPAAAFPAKTIHIPELAYSAVYGNSYEPQAVAAAVASRIEAEFDRPCDIVHVHNPLLAKNRTFLKFLSALQTRGLNLLLQIHDFAEDGRPHLYYSEDYPADCHYSVVNSRDYQILLKCGLKESGLHQLFNCIRPPEHPLSAVEQGPYVVYPVRALRRKNIGEALLLTLFFAGNETLVITLPPNSAADIASYQGWKAFARDHHLKVEFDRGLNHPFASIVASARYLLTTSITEGFGFSFLEPWLFDKLVCGRKIADICHDFESRGVCLDHMYTQLKVPLDWFDSKDFSDQWERAVRSTAARFELHIDPSRIQTAYDTITADGTIDLGLLSETYQRQVLQRLISQKSLRQKLASLNPYLAKIGRVAGEKKLIASNRNAVVDNYGLAAYRQNLLNVYARVAATPVQHCIDKKKLLMRFFDLTRFSLLKWGNHEA